jgi:protein SCO1/2
VKRSGWWCAVLGCAVLALLLVESPRAQNPTAGTARGGPEMHGDPDKAREYFTDVVLVNQDGEPMRFFSDLLQVKTVVINAFFTSCPGVCPILSRKLVAIQEGLGDHLGKDLHLISISVDPQTDTPPLLKAYAERFDARPGWYFLGGPKENVEWALHKLGQRVDDKEAHTNVFIIGNASTGRWKKVLGLAPPEEILEVVADVLDDPS